MLLFGMHGLGKQFMKKWETGKNYNYVVSIYNLQIFYYWYVFYTPNYNFKKV